MTGIIETVGLFLLLLGTLVFVHEAGHFVVAKLLGIRVETFSLGFGPRLLGFRRGETDYRLSGIPLGGYVKMTGEMVGDPSVYEDDPRAFASKPRWARFLVLVAGAACNLVLAIVVWTGIYIHGIEVAVVPEGPPVVETVVPGGAAERAGILPGDVILAVQQQPVGNLTDYRKLVVFDPGKTVPFELERGGRRFTVEVTLDRATKYHLGDEGLYVRLPFQVVRVDPDSPAAAAGLQAGDRIVRLDGQPVVSQSDLRSDLKASGGRRIELTIEREGQSRTVSLVPATLENGEGQIGVLLGPRTKFVALGPVGAVRRAFSTAGEYVDLLFLALRKMITMAIGLRAMSGPIEIATFAQEAAERGALDFLNFMALVSLQLGIINLLPIPVLDGGNILILLVEGVARRDLSQAFKERVMQLGLIFLLVFMVAVIGFDILKSLPSSGG